MSTTEFHANYGVGYREVAVCALAGICHGFVLHLFAPPLAAAAGACLAAAMLLISLIDARRLIIPDILSLPLVPLGIAVAAGLAAEAWEQVMLWHTGAAAVAAGALYVVRWLYWQVRGVEGLGLGDVKLLAAAGAWVGFDTLSTTLLMASCAALAATLVRHGLSSAPPVHGQTRVPFGTFLAPSILIIWSAEQWPY